MLTRWLTRAVAFGVVFGKVEIWVDLPAVQIVEVDSLSGDLGRFPRGHEAEHAGENAAAGWSLLVRAERFSRGSRLGGGRGWGWGLGRQWGLRAPHRRLGQLPPPPWLGRLVAARRPRQLHLRVGLDGRAVPGTPGMVSKFKLGFGFAVAMLKYPSRKKTIDIWGRIQKWQQQQKSHRNVKGYSRWRMQSMLFAVYRQCHNHTLRMKLLIAIKKALALMRFLSFSSITRNWPGIYYERQRRSNMRSLARSLVNIKHSWSLWIVSFLTTILLVKHRSSQP